MDRRRRAADRADKTHLTGLLAKTLAAADFESIVTSRASQGRHQQKIGNRRGSWGRGAGPLQNIAPFGCEERTHLRKEARQSDRRESASHMPRPAPIPAAAEVRYIQSAKFCLLFRRIRISRSSRPRLPQRTSPPSASAGTS